MSIFSILQEGKLEEPTSIQTKRPDCAIKRKDDGPNSQTKSSENVFQGIYVADTSPEVSVSEQGGVAR